MIIFKNGFFKIWDIQQKEKYKLVKTSTSESYELDGEKKYKNSSWFCKFVGKANEKELNVNDMIKVTSGKIENVWDKEKERSWLNIIIFDFEQLNSGQNDDTIDSNDDDLPF